MDGLCPEVSRAISECWNAPVTHYAARIFCAVPQPVSAIGKTARQYLRDTFKQQLKLIVQPQDVEAALAGFDARPVIQAGVHSQLLLDPITFNAFLLGWLGAVEIGLPAFFVFSGTTVTMETMGKEGPGWLDAGDRQINLFGMGRHKLCRQSVCGAGPVELNREALEEIRGAAGTSGWLELLLANGDRKWGNAADALAEINADLVAHWNEPASARPVFFDDRHAALLVARHLDDEGSLVSRLITDPARRAHLERALEDATSGPYGRFMPLSTQHFFGLREKRVRKLVLAGDRLVEAERPQGVSVPLERVALRDALRHGILLPNLFLLFLVMSILPRVRVLGGFRQIGYLPLFQAALRRVLDPADSDERALLEDLSVRENAWGMRVIEDDTPVRERLAEVPAGRLLETLRVKYSQRTLAEETDSLRLLRESRRWRRLMGLPVD